MIYYELQHHGELDGLELLITSLEHEKNILNISLDINEIQTANIDSKTYNFKSINIEKSDSLTWGGFGITNRMFESLVQALEHSEWEYYINLSGSCIPLKTQEFIHAYLLEEKTKNSIFNFCYSFSVNKPIYYYFDENENNSVEVPYARVNFRTNKKFKKIISTKEFEPANDVIQRISAKFVEEEKNYFQLNGLSSREVAERKTLFNHNPYKVGKQWVILHRDTVEWLVYSSYVKDVMTVLKSVFISDETFFQMVLFSEENPYRHLTSPENLRYHNGKIVDINISNIGKILATSSLFARKVDKRCRKEVFAILKEKISGQTPRL